MNFLLLHYWVLNQTSYSIIFKSGIVGCSYIYDYSLLSKITLFCRIKIYLKGVGWLSVKFNFFSVILSWPRHWYWLPKEQYVLILVFIDIKQYFFFIITLTNVHRCIDHFDDVVIGMQGRRTYSYHKIITYVKQRYAFLGQPKHY